MSGEAVALNAHILLPERVKSVFEGDGTCNRGYSDNDEANFDRAAAAAVIRTQRGRMNERVGLAAVRTIGSVVVTRPPTQQIARTMDRRLETRRLLRAGPSSLAPPPSLFILPRSLALYSDSSFHFLPTTITTHCVLSFAADSMPRRGVRHAPIKNLDPLISIRQKRRLAEDSEFTVYTFRHSLEFLFGAHLD